MYATREQIGQDHGLPGLPGNGGRPRAGRKPDAATSPPSPAYVAERAPGSPRQSSHAAVPAAGDDADDEMKLSDPVEIPADQYLPKRLSDMLHDAPGSRRDRSRTPPRPQVAAGSRRHDATPAAHDEFAVKCPTCDTLVYATEDEIGQQKTCPDCFSIVTITRPRPKPRRVNEVVDADYEGQLFTLSEPVSLDIYHQHRSWAGPQDAGRSGVAQGGTGVRPAEAGRVGIARDSLVGWALPVPAAFARRRAVCCFRRAARRHRQTHDGDCRLGPSAGAVAGARGAARDPLSSSPCSR